MPSSYDALPPLPPLPSEAEQANLVLGWGAEAARRLMTVEQATPQERTSWRRMDAARQRMEGEEESVHGYIGRRAIPGFSTGVQVAEGLEERWARQRIEAGTATRRDYDHVAWMERMGEIAENRGIGGDMLDLAARIPAFAGEFGATSGAFSAGRTAVTGLVRGAAPGAVRQAAATGAGFVAGAAAQTAVSPQLAARITERMRDPNTSFLEAVGPGAVDALVETIAEHSGLGLTRVAGAVGRGAARYSGASALYQRLGGQRVNDWLQVGMMNRIASRLPSMPEGARRLLDRARAGAARLHGNPDAQYWHGAFGEYLEERFGEALRMPLLGGVFGEEGHGGRLANLGQAAVAAAEGNWARSRAEMGEFFRESLVEGGAFMLYGRVRRGGQLGRGFFTEPRRDTPAWFLERDVAATALVRARQESPEAFEQTRQALAGQLPHYNLHTEEGLREAEQFVPGGTQQEGPIEVGAAPGPLQEVEPGIYAPSSAQGEMAPEVGPQQQRLLTYQPNAAPSTAPPSPTVAPGGVLTPQGGQSPTSVPPITPGAAQDGPTGYENVKDIEVVRRHAKQGVIGAQRELAKREAKPPVVEPAAQSSAATNPREVATKLEAEMGELAAKVGPKRGSTGELDRQIRALTEAVDNATKRKDQPEVTRLVRELTQLKTERAQARKRRDALIGELREARDAAIIWEAEETKKKKPTMVRWPRQPQTARRPLRRQQPAQPKDRRGPGRPRQGTFELLRAEHPEWSMEKIARRAGEIADQARNDALTGLLSAKTYFEDVESGKYGKFVSLYDIPGLGAVNKYGDQAGDAFLQAYAAALRQAGVENGYRKGGDELAAIYQTAEEQKTAGDKLEKLLAGMEVTWTDKDGKVAIMSGVFGVARSDGASAFDAQSKLNDAKEVAVERGFRAREKGQLPPKLRVVFEEGVPGAGSKGGRGRNADVPGGEPGVQGEGDLALDDAGRVIDAPARLKEVFDRAGLTQRDQYILRRRLEGMSQPAIGKKMGLTRARIQQLEKAALAKLGINISEAIRQRIQREEGRKNLKIKGKQAESLEDGAPDHFNKFSERIATALEKAKAEGHTTEAAQFAYLDKVLPGWREVKTEAQAKEFLAKLRELEKAKKAVKKPRKKLRKPQPVHERPLPKDASQVAYDIREVSKLGISIKSLGMTWKQAREEFGDEAVMYGLITSKGMAVDEVAIAMAKRHMLPGIDPGVQIGKQEFIGQEAGKSHAADVLLERMRDAHRQGWKGINQINEDEEFLRQWEQAAREAQEAKDADDLLWGETGTFWVPDRAVLYEWVQKAMAAVKPRKRSAAPAVRTAQTILPRFQPYHEEKVIFTDPLMLARIPGAGGFLDPRALADNGTDQAYITWAASDARGKSFATTEALRIKGKYGADLFQADKDGWIKLTNGQRGTMADVIEAELTNRGSQPITDKQRDFIWNEWLPMLRDFRAMLLENGVRRFADEEGEVIETSELDRYFPRPAVGKRKVEGKFPGGIGNQTRPGGKKFFQKERHYETEQAGIEAEDSIIYEPNYAARIAKMLAGGYRAVADKRLATDESLGGMTPRERYELLKIQNRHALKRFKKGSKNRAAYLAQLKQEAALRGKAAHAVGLRESYVTVAPAFMGKIYPIEVANKLKRMFGESSHDWVRKLESVNSASKALTAVFDWSVMWIQGLPVMYRRPTVWARSLVNMGRAMFDPKVSQRMAQTEAQAIREFVQSGGTWGRPQDALAGAGEGDLATRIPVIGRPIAAFGRSASAFFDTAKILLWKAHRDNVPKEQWHELAESIETTLGLGRMEQIGLHPGRALGERLLFFAPMYLRAGVANVAAMTQRGVSGKLARQYMGSMIGGVVLTFIGAMLAMGFDWDEIEERLDPTSGQFLRLPVRIGGSTHEVGFGHIVLQLGQLAARSITYFTEDRLINTGVEGNPFLRFLDYKLAALPGLAFEIRSGRDFQNRPVGAGEAVTRRFIPFAIQEVLAGDETLFQGASDLIRGEADWRERGPSALFSFFGLQSYTRSPRTEYYGRFNELAQARHGRPYADLTFTQARQVAAEVRRVHGGPPSADERGAEMGRRAADQRRSQLMTAINDESRRRLGEFNHTLPSYQRTLASDGVTVPLADRWVDRYEQLLVEEYDRMIGAWDMAALRRLSPAMIESALERRLRLAKERAQARLRQVMNGASGTATPARPIRIPQW